VAVGRANEVRQTSASPRLREARRFSWVTDGVDASGAGNPKPDGVEARTGKAAIRSHATSRALTSWRRRLACRAELGHDGSLQHQAEMSATAVWLRTDGVNTDGAAAKVVCFAELDLKKWPGTFEGKWNQVNEGTKTCPCLRI